MKDYLERKQMRIEKFDKNKSENAAKRLKVESENSAKNGSVSWQPNYLWFFAFICLMVYVIYIFLVFRVVENGRSGKDVEAGSLQGQLQHNG